MANTQKATMAPAATDPAGAGRPPTVRADETSEVRSLSPEARRKLESEAADLEARAAEIRRRIGMGRPVEPSFGISEGTRAELETRQERIDRGDRGAEKTVVVSPFTGLPLDGDGRPRGE